MFPKTLPYFVGASIIVAQEIVCQEKNRILETNREFFSYGRLNTTEENTTNTIELMVSGEMIGCFITFALVDSNYHRQSFCSQERNQAHLGLLEAE